MDTKIGQPEARDAFESAQTERWRPESGAVGPGPGRMSRGLVSGPERRGRDALGWDGKRWTDQVHDSGPEDPETVSVSNRGDAAPDHRADDQIGQSTKTLWAKPEVPRSPERPLSDDAEKPPPSGENGHGASPAPDDSTARPGLTLACPTWMALIAIGGPGGGEPGEEFVGGFVQIRQIIRTVSVPCGSSNSSDWLREAQSVASDHDATQGIAPEQRGH